MSLYLAQETRNMVITSDKQLAQITLEKPSIFLAGSMPVGGESNWRRVVVDALGDQYQLFDPTHPNHDKLNDSDMREHIKWEWEALKRSDYVLFNFLPNATSPISLLELGMYISSGKAIVVCPKEFYKWQYIDALCQETNTPIYSTLHEALNNTIFHLTNQ